MRSIDRRIARLEGGRSELVIQPLALIEDLSLGGVVQEKPPRPLPITGISTFRRARP
jgi:hypothetical protein